MEPRPRRAAAAAANRNLQAAANIDPDADPDFLALSSRQRRAIDKAFLRGIRISSGRSLKRRKIEPASKGGSSADDVFDEDGGGFVVEDDAGGFLPEDDGGGFMVDDDAAGGFVNDGDEDMGGFVPDDGPSTSTTRPSSPSIEKIPLQLIPSLLVSLQLPADDDVLQVFRASASGWDDEDQTGSSRKRGEEESGGYVGKKDFRAVCAALMGPDEDDGGDGEGDDDDDAEDAFELEGDGSESELSAVSSGYSDDGRKGKGKGKATETPSGRSRRAKKNKVLEEEAAVRLSSRQKEMVADIWKMLMPNAGDRPGDRILGRNEVKALVRNLGEMWTEDEVGLDACLWS